MSGAEKLSLAGPAGAIEAVRRAPEAPTAAAVVCHPHPLYGGTMHNEVVLETERALLRAGAAVLRFNFRGVGASGGEHDGGDGERLDLAVAIAEIERAHPGLPLVLAGYSFGAVVTLGLLSEPAMAPDRTSAPAGVLLLAPPVAYYAGRGWTAGGAPVAIVYGTRDELTPATDLEREAATWSNELLITPVEDTGHDLGTMGNPGGLRLALSESLRFLGLPAQTTA
jgi:alpha/beta superfamily hydrolase